MELKNNIPCSMLSLLILFCFSLKPHLFCFGADNYDNNIISSSTQMSLSGSQTIVSPRGVFELGFFKAGASTNHYIGMWHKRVSYSQRKAVWVANREKPVRDIQSSVLKISGTGNLVLFNEFQVPIWSTNITSTITNSSSVEAALLDDGNLVLRDRLNSSTIHWQSFDHPTDTAFPGWKYRYNKLTKECHPAISWKGKNDPAPGLFSLKIHPTTPEIIVLWNGSQQYWTSGPWEEKTHTFTTIPYLGFNILFNMSFVSNENESYFSYSLHNPSIIVLVILDYNGQITVQSWLESSKQWVSYWSSAPPYAFCGPFGRCHIKNAVPLCDCLTGFRPKSQKSWQRKDYSGGCVRQTKLQYCNNAHASVGNGDGSGDQFLKILNTTFPSDPRNVMAYNPMECKSACLKDCSCTAYAYEEDLGCLVWIGDILNLQQLGQENISKRTLYIRTAGPSTSPSSTNKEGAIIISAVVSAVSAGLLILGLLMFIIMRRKRRGTVISKLLDGGGSLMAFGYKDLQKATKNFSEKLGKGGFGTVFKGTLPDESVIAVKKLEGIDRGDKQFRSEVSTIGMINHVNLVRLRGFCSQGSSKLLVYDYMPNGSLDSHLFHSKSLKILDWKTRYQIALGAARGLAYLHDNCRDSIIHCDVKPENILLDANLCPKLADFGLAKIMGREFSRVLTTMRGTIGYLAPEWISGVAITPKADVYSYGMMAFEIISGRRNFVHDDDDDDADADEDEGTYFPTLAARQLTQGADLLKLLDRRLDGNADVEEVSRVCKVACWCIQDNEIRRPTMSEVVQILEGDLDVSLPPIPRLLEAFEIGNDQEQTCFFTAQAISL